MQMYLRHATHVVDAEVNQLGVPMAAAFMFKAKAAVVYC